MKGPKFTLGALRPSHAPSGKIFIAEKCTCPVYTYVKFQLSSSGSFRDMMGPKFTLGALCPPHAPSEKSFMPEKST